ncbi:MAG: ribosomal protein methyltransferase [Actinomycetota bacterium]
MTEVPAAWTLAEFVVGRDRSELLADGLWALGVVAVEESTASDGRTLLRTSVDESVTGAVSALAGAHGAQLTWVSVPTHVADTWRRHAVPTPVSDGLWLVPAWVEPPPGTSVLVEPFGTFGLGNHPTTVLALRAAMRCVDEHSLVLDMGSGSGVLAVALAVTTGVTCECHDISAAARGALEHNARLNGVSESVGWRGPLTDADEGRYDLVVANILAPVLRGLAPELSTAVRRGGVIVLSGIRADQADAVTATYDGTTVEAVEDRDGWVAVTLRRDD